MISAAATGRLSGLAVALGVGAAIAGACAATASAAPTDDRERPGISRDAATSPGPRATSRADSTEKRNTLRHRDSSERPAVRPASVVSARRAVVRAAATAAVAPVKIDRVIDRAAAPVEPAPAATTATPAVTVQQPRLGDPRGRLVTIYKGTHFAIPNRWALWVKKVTGDATFIPDSAYDLKDADQLDWNKLAGITFTPWRPERDASMVVWRYNLTTEEFEVGPFWDVNFAYVFPTDDEVISIPVGQTFSYAVDYDGITVSYGDKTVYKPTPQGLTPNFWTSARITGWFGGSEVAPRTVSYYLHMR